MPAIPSRHLLRICVFASALVLGALQLAAPPAQACGGFFCSQVPVDQSGEDIVFVGSGHGHGVGMSQWGAKAMASRGAGHREILAAFYPGSTLEMDAGRLATPAVASGREN